MKIEEYLADKIEGRIRRYESGLKKINAAYRADVERVASRQDDPAWAKFFRETVQPSHIAGELRNIRFLLALGKIVEADRALEDFRGRVEFVEWRLLRRYLTAGMGKSRGGIKSTATRRDDADDRADRMCRDWSRFRAKGYSKGKADQAVARAFKVSTKTVRTARKNKLAKYS